MHAKLYNAFTKIIILLFNDACYFCGSLHTLDKMNVYICEY